MLAAVHIRYSVSILLGGEDGESDSVMSYIHVKCVTNTGSYPAVSIHR